MLFSSTTPMLVQGITGHHGSFHTKLMLEYGTNIVAGVTPGKGGQEVEGVPVYDSVSEAKAAHNVEWSIIFVPALFVLDAALDAIEAGLHIVVISEHVPVHDVMKILDAANKKDVFFVGPNCPGIIVPGESKFGIMPGDIFTPGNVGVLSRSGTLTYEIVSHLTEAGIGQQCVIGIGGDTITGVDFLEGLAMMEAEDAIDTIVLIGEIGGEAEERAATFIKKEVTKPVVAYVAGKTAPPGKTMGHAGAIISQGKGTFASKKQALEQAGVKVASLPKDVITLLS